MEWEDCQSYVLEIFSEYWSELKGVCVEKREEITPTHLKWLLKRARGMGYVDEMDSFASDLRVDYFDNYLYHIKEKCYQVPLSYEMAMKRAKGIMADESFIEELERIYAKENIKKFYGNPVHYCLRVGSKETAQEMIDILIPALKTNERLLGHAVSISMILMRDVTKKMMCKIFLRRLKDVRSWLIWERAMGWMATIPLPMRRSFIIFRF